MRRHTDERAHVLVLHGGQQHSTEPTSWRQLSVLRSRLFAAAVARAGRQDRIGVSFLRYAQRGWNDGAPLRDATWALARVREEHPGIPVGLLGYSMGGRTALHLAGEVDALVTAAAWVEQADLPAVHPPTSGRALLLHGTEDQMTSPEGTLRAAERLREQGAEVDVRTDLADTHGMMRHRADWHRLAGAHLVQTLRTSTCDAGGRGAD
ncbi:hypothetical protein SGUI_2029 [Serinicoccus hydrothermalis]|uniref:Peptidase S9 prolyl oligopeptidase catalytic domain-containing protein n=1 Tax=Serinicoccus hydrothermalis TaxID=1758689 RepID=A0A1B1NDJ8_9MICO|nr:hypothetical protein SGUI_2029 [Serinicoccus hydrothermalis]